MNDKNNFIFRYGPVKENENFADTGSLLKTAIVINLTGIILNRLHTMR